MKRLVKAPLEKMTETAKIGYRQMNFATSVLKNNKEDFDLEDENAEKLFEEGMVYIPDYADEEKCQELREKIDELIEEEKEDVIYVEGDEFHDLEFDQNDTVVWTRGGEDEGMIEIRNAENIITELNEFKNDQYLLDLVNSVSNIEYEPEMRIYVNKSITETRGYHADTVLADPFGGAPFKIFTYLTDVDDKGYGPYSFVKGSHHEIPKRFLNVYKNLLTGGRVNDMPHFFPSKAETVLASKGDVAVSHQAGVHRGTPQEEGKERYVLVTTYTAK